MSEIIILGVNKDNYKSVKADNVILVPEIFTKNWGGELPYDIWCGSRFSAKSWTKAIEFLYKCASKDYFRGIFARLTKVAARDSQFQLFKDLLNHYPILKDKFTIREQSMKIVCKENGNYIKGGSFQDSDGLMSVPELTDFWAEEPITRNGSITRQQFLDIAGTLRNAKGIQPRFHFTFNPISKENFIYEDFFGDKRIYDGKVNIIKANYPDNPFCPADRIEYLEELKASNHRRYLIDGLGEWGDPINETPFFFNFDEDKHVGETQLNDRFSVILAFDFNHNPTTCTVMQKTDRLVIHDVIQGIGTRGCCEKILKSEYMDYSLEIVGDANGNSDQASALTTSFQIIEDKLGVKLSSRQWKANASHEFSFNLCNHMFFVLTGKLLISHKLVKLIAEIKIAQLIISDKGKKNLRKDNGTFRMDRVDSLRYGFHYCFKNIKEVNNFR